MAPVGPMPSINMPAKGAMAMRRWRSGEDQAILRIGQMGIRRGPPAPAWPATAGPGSDGGGRAPTPPAPASGSARRGALWAAGVTGNSMVATSPASTERALGVGGSIQGHAPRLLPRPQPSVSSPAAVDPRTLCGSVTAASRSWWPSPVASSRAAIPGNPPLEVPASLPEGLGPSHQGTACAGLGGPIVVLVLTGVQSVLPRFELIDGRRFLLAAPLSSGSFVIQARCSWPCGPGAGARVGPGRWRLAPLPSTPLAASA